jgi:hypothetical protein
VGGVARAERVGIEVEEAEGADGEKSRDYDSGEPASRATVRRHAGST